LDTTNSVTDNLSLRLAFFRGPDGEVIEPPEDKTGYS